jgi:hypothetical protein
MPSSILELTAMGLSPIAQSSKIFEKWPAVAQWAERMKVWDLKDA